MALKKIDPRRSKKCLGSIQSYVHEAKVFRTDEVISECEKSTEITPNLFREFNPFNFKRFGLTEETRMVAGFLNCLGVFSISP